MPPEKQAGCLSNLSVGQQQWLFDLLHLAPGGFIQRYASACSVVEGRDINCVQNKHNQQD
jgi:hypothetical protein